MSSAYTRMEKLPNSQTSQICLLSVGVTLGPSLTSDWPPISRGQKIGTSNNKRAGQISHAVSSNLLTF